MGNIEIEKIEGGVTAAKGFKAGAAACGLKKGGKKDVALVVSDVPAAVAGIFTKNVIKGHSLQYTRDIVTGSEQAKANGANKVNAVFINSGNANACLGGQGDANAQEMASYAAQQLGIKAREVLLGSTGVIGMALDMSKIKSGIQAAVAALSNSGGHNAAEAIMTTDTFAKEAAVEFQLSAKGRDGTVSCRIGGMAKGSGMISPDMATMISIITTDASISPALLQQALKKAADSSFNRITVDGDTSVCDMVVVLANGISENRMIDREIHDGQEDDDYRTFYGALAEVCTSLSKMLAKDGEGATKLVEITVSGAGNNSDAHLIASAIANSPLVKTAIFGEDANCGRIITAAGYSGAKFDPSQVDISINGMTFYKNGIAVRFDEIEAKKALSAKEIVISAEFKEGNGCDRMWTCDFSYDYVKINGSYRS